MCGSEPAVGGSGATGLRLHTKQEQTDENTLLYFNNGSFLAGSNNKAPSCVRALMHALWLPVNAETCGSPQTPCVPSTFDLSAAFPHTRLFLKELCGRIHLVHVQIVAVHDYFEQKSSSFSFWYRGDHLAALLRNNNMLLWAFGKIFFQE